LEIASRCSRLRWDSWVRWGMRTPWNASWICNSCTRQAARLRIAPAGVVWISYTVFLCLRTHFLHLPRLKTTLSGLETWLAKA